MRLNITLVFLFFVFFIQNINAQKPSAEERSVQLSAVTQTSPPQIQLKWKADSGASKYVVYRKALTDSNWGDPIIQLPGNATSYTDNNVVVGVGYEYAFFKEDFAPRIDVVCVDPGTEVKFTINDMYGVGLCCSFGHGYYEIQNCNTLVGSGNDFGFMDEVVFTACNDGSGCSEIYITVKTDMFENSNSWTIRNNQNGAVLASSGSVGSFLKPRPEYGFIYAGIELPAIEERGRILLLVENSLTASLINKIQDLELDYIKDGWKVSKEYINPSETVTDVKATIVDVYNQHSDLKAIFILGHIPIPFSGDIFPDTHSELRGSYAADVYYGEMNGVWTDQTVNNTSAIFDIYHNIPNDGKFDQSAIPTGVVELQVGRVDFSNMPAFSASETTLIQQYLNKNHAFKHRQIKPERRALVDDNFQQSFAAPAASGYRNFSTMFGADNIVQADYFTTLKNESYLWSYGCGGGSIVSSEGIGTTEDFSNSSLKSIFTMLFGSQFGNWAYTDDFLRAPLASGFTLTNCWAGNPPWTLHHMAMGYNIGYSLLKTQNESNQLYLGNGPQLVHVALMGDPTLRMHMVQPPSNLQLATVNNKIQLSWTAPNDETVAGYYIYRANALDGDFVRINSTAVIGTSFKDEFPMQGKNIYMVKTLKLENSASGSYYNLSLGIMKNTNIDLINNTDDISQQNISVFPNPATEKIIISFRPLETEDLNLKLVDALGRVIFTKEIKKNTPSEEVNISEFPTGIYFVNIKGKNKEWTKQIVIE